MNTILAKPHKTPTKKRMPTVKFDAIIEVYDSRMIKGVQYDHKKQILDVAFESDTVYRYLNVTPLEFTLLITSRSTGQTFNSVIRNVKEYRKLKRKMLAIGARS